MYRYGLLYMYRYWLLYEWFIYWRIYIYMVLILKNSESFALTQDILFNASKTKYMLFNRCESVHMAPLYCKSMHIHCVPECDLLGITLSTSRTADNAI